MKIGCPEPDIRLRSEGLVRRVVSRFMGPAADEIASLTRPPYFLAARGTTAQRQPIGMREVAAPALKKLSGLAQAFSLFSRGSAKRGGSRNDFVPLGWVRVMARRVERTFHRAWMLLGALLVGATSGCGSSSSSPGPVPSAGSGAFDANGGKGGHDSAGAAGALPGASGAGGTSGASGFAGFSSSASGSSGFDPAVLDVGELTVTYCATVKKCCGALPVDEAFVKVFCDPSTEGTLNLIIAGKVAGDRAAIAACDAAYKAAAESCSAVEIRKACRDFVAGTQKVGEPCLTSEDARGQCKVEGGTAACAPTSVPAMGNMGVCTEVKRGTLGEHCDLNCPASGCDTWVPLVTAPVGCFEADGLTCSYPHDGRQTCSPVGP